VNFSEVFIRRPIATSLLMAAIALFGIVSYRALPVSDLPTVDFPTLQISASLPGADPSTMASAVATPLERQFTAIAGLDSMTSVSSVGSTQEEIALAVLAEIVAERHAHQPSHPVALPASATDPICGMMVEIKGAMHTLPRGETTYYFCSAGCLEAFKGREGQDLVARPSPSDASSR